MDKERCQTYGSWHEEEGWRKDGGSAATECPGDVGDVAAVHEFEEEANIGKNAKGEQSEVW